MANVETTTTKKSRPRTRVAAVPQLADLPERVGVVETKLEYTNEKIDDLKADVKEMHDCLDLTRNGIMNELKSMNNTSTHQHEELAGKISDLEKFKNKWTMYIMVVLAFGAGTGIAGQINLSLILKFLGL
jgi:uncharacterized coiled-coil DUF342 family protein